MGTAPEGQHIDAAERVTMEGCDKAPAARRKRA